jgi:hypothetical protein
MTAKIQDAIHLETLATHLGVVTQSGKNALKEKTEIWTSDLKKLKQRSAEFAIIQGLAKEGKLDILHPLFTELKDLEPEIDALITKASDLELEAFNELLFLKDWSTPFNFIPFLLTIWALIRVYVFPGMALLMPLMILVLPFILVRFVFRVPLTVGRYFHMITAMFSGQIESLFNPNVNPAPPTFDFLALAKHGVIIATVVQSFLQPYWSFQHLSAIDQIIHKKAIALQRFQELYSQIDYILTERGFTMRKNPFAREIEDNRQLVAEAQLHPAYLKLALKNLGSLEVLLRAASDPGLVPVTWLSNSEPVFQLTGGYDYRVGTTRVPFHIRLDGKQGHSLLTGPNRGGKSTTLRAILTSCALAHTYGFAFAEQASMTPFKRLYICLTPEDLPGKKSRFEREIEFTAETLKETGRSLVLLDELYHSTNPPDAAQACTLYTERLWAKSNTLSIISTHLFDFVEKAPKAVQRLCCPATEQEDGSIRYSYQLSPGISKVSSVKELLIENGLTDVSKYRK